jgi:hypothetical protein
MQSGGAQRAFRRDDGAAGEAARRQRAVEREAPGRPPEPAHAGQPFGRGAAGHNPSSGGKSGKGRVPSRSI